MEAITELYHRLTGQVKKQQSEKNVYRKELNRLNDEREQFLKMLVGKDAAINNLQIDLKSLEDQLESVVAEKCEMATREQTLLDIEKVLEKEIDRLNGEIIALTGRLNKTTFELVALKQDNASTGAQMATDLKETLEELRVAKLTIYQMEESNQLIESKYANEMLAHSSDLQTLKDELRKYDEQINRLKLSKDEAVKMLKSRQLEWEITNQKSNENLQEFKRKVEDLEMQNMEFQAQNSEFLTTRSVQFNDTVANISITNEELEKRREEEDITATQMDVRHLTDSNITLRAEKKDLECKVNELTVKVAKIEAQLLPLLSKKFEEKNKLSDRKESKRFENERDVSVSTIELESESRQNAVDLTQEHETTNVEQQERRQRVIQTSNTIAVQASLPGSVAPPSRSRVHDQVENLSVRTRRNDIDDSMDDLVMAGSDEILNNETNDENNPDLVDTMSQASSGESNSKSPGTEASNQTHELTDAANNRETDKDLSTTQFFEDMTSESESEHDVSDIVSLEGSDTVQTIDLQKDFKRNKTKYQQQTQPVVERPYRCDICYKGFKSRSHLNGHIRVHTDERPFECDLCASIFKTRSNLTYHMQVHNDDRPFECDICAADFKRRQDLVKHMRIHSGEKPYSCEICFKKFSENCNLKRHLEHQHTGDNPYKCEICPAVFNSRKFLNKHKKMHDDMGHKKVDSNGIDIETLS